MLAIPARSLLSHLLVALLFAASPVQVGAEPGPGEQAPRPLPPLPIQWNVRLVDSAGVEVKIVAFRMVSGDERFQGYRGAGEIEIPYERVRRLTIAPSAEPGGRMRATFLVASGSSVETTFDQREAELLWSGLASFGQVIVAMREIRLVEFLGRTGPDDLPDWDRPGGSLEVILGDRQGVETRLTGFHRLAGENRVSGLHGATTISIPLLHLVRLQMREIGESQGREATVELRGGEKVTFRLPSAEEKVSFGGESEFGRVSIQLRDITSLLVLSVPPPPSLPGQGAEGCGEAEPEAPSRSATPN